MIKRDFLIKFIFHLLPEPFLESVPQVHIILMVVFGSVYATVTDNGSNATVDPQDPQAIATFALSVFSAAFGITKFFSVGPCRLMPYEKMNLGFFLMMLNVASCLVGKGLQLAMAAGNSEFAYTIGTWVSLSIVPQVVFVSI